MLTGAEKGYLVLTLFFLATGSGIKAYRHGSVEIGPSASDSLSATPEPPSGNPPHYGEAAAKKDTAARAPGRESPDPRAKDASASVLEPDAPGPRDEKSAGSGRKAEFAGKININRAGAAELMSVSGVGDKTARAIVEYRRAHGPYRRLRDLLQVKGIGEKKLEKLIPYLIL